MKTIYINGMSIKASNYKEAMEYVWFAKCRRAVTVSISRDGHTMSLELSITAQTQSPYLEDNILSAVKDHMAFIGIEYDAFEVSLNGKWLSSSEL